MVVSNIEASQLLKQIPSASIKKIELITNPSAKYNPECLELILSYIKTLPMGLMQASILV
jgi:hypothetical protein